MGKRRNLSTLEKVNGTLVTLRPQNNIDRTLYMYSIH